MKWQEHISSELGIKKEKLPSGFQRIGKVAILNLPKELMQKKEQIGELTLDFRKRIKTVCINKSPIRGEFRVPDIEVVAGNKTETIHKENGCKFFLDVKKVMFSKGNVNERMRMKKTTRGIVLDMFAGIGYFSIPAALNKKVEKVHAIEKNPESFDFLEKNIKINNANARPYSGDCKKIIQKNDIKADQVIMGLLPDPIGFLEYGLDCLKQEGVIYYHLTHDIDKELDMNVIKQIIRKKSYRLSNVEKRLVKKYGPRVNHVVLDLKITS